MTTPTISSADPASAPQTDGATPVIAQYLRVKADYKDCLLFFRMGDFYEMFFDDAVTAAGALDIVLTKRGKFQDEAIPMCGVPVHSYESYAEKLVRQGHRIAVCEQVESPEEAKKRGYKAVVNRQVTRVLTPGTVTEENLLNPRAGSYIVALYGENNRFCLFRYDVTSGRTAYTETGAGEIDRTLARIRPAEVIFAGDAAKAAMQSIGEEYPAFPVPETGDAEQAEKLWPSAERDALSPLTERTFLILAAYVKRTQGEDKPLFRPPLADAESAVLQLDARTVESLEIFKATDGDKKSALLTALDNAVTACGARLTRERLAAPSADRFEIENRLDNIDFFLNHLQLRLNIRDALKKTADAERIIGRVKLRRASPADLASLRETLFAFAEVADFLTAYAETAPLHILSALNALSVAFRTTDYLQAALADAPPASLQFGGFIRPGFDAALDEYAALKNDARSVILAMETEFKNKTNVSALKIKHNNIIGYHIDVPSGHAGKLLNAADGAFIHKQTLANSVRFTAVKLIEVEKKISEAEIRFTEREKQIFQTLVTVILEEETPLLLAVEAAALLDISTAQADLAEMKNYVRPVFCEEKRLRVKDGRHPVVENLLRKKEAKSFTPNDCLFSPKKGVSPDLYLLTGPNMGGKSTYLRQNALMILMAQAGMFVPAESYEASLFDKIFSRVGASDNIARGQSTFMTEMSETARILKEATSASFVILDELGRGTATCDGLAIALATANYLVKEIRSLTLFATHYHELAGLTAHNPRIGVLQVKVSEFKNEIIFLHKVAPGAAGRSYGLHVAGIAGVPLPVLHEAKIWAERFDAGGFGKAADYSQTPLFEKTDQKTDFSAEDVKAFQALLKDLVPERLSPLEAFTTLREIKEKFNAVTAAPKETV